MALFTGTQREFIISPRELCESCLNSTGPKFILSHLHGPSDLHRSNIIPTGSERESLEASIDSAYSQAAQLEEEISRLQMTLQTLTERREALYRFAKQEQGLFSPIRKLNADVLRQIFIIAHEESEYISCDDLEALPRIVTQVSLFWRSVAHSCAPLWTDVYASNYQEKYGLTYGELIRKCVTFSNQLPIKLDLMEGCTPSVLGSDCVRALGECAHRWKSMMIRDAELSKSIFANIPTAYTWFSELTDLYSITDPAYVTRIDSAESLVDLTLRNISHPLSTLYGMPWEQITQFYVGHLDCRPGEFFDILRKMENLVSLSITDATNPLSTGPILTLPHLVSLSLSDIADTNVLKIVTAPSLKNLSLNCEFDSDVVVEFAGRSHFSLEDLTICGMAIDDTWASQEFKSLKCLYWIGPQSVGTGIQWLTNYRVPSPAETFPCLKSLHIVNLPTLREDDEDPGCSTVDIIDMLLSRIPTQEEGVPNDPAVTRQYLKHVFISFQGVLDQDDISNFEGFLQSDAVRWSGVRISVIDGVGTRTYY